MIFAIALAQAMAAFRPPAVPLVTSDPYLSIWSEADNLPGSVTRHWTHAEQPMTCVLTLDRRLYLLCGTSPAPQGMNQMVQKHLEVTPTRSIYTFECPQVRVNMTFMTPALSESLDIYSRPVTYVTWDVTPLDGHPHKASIDCSVGCQLAVNNPTDRVDAETFAWPGYVGAQASAMPQHLLKPAGDDTRIDWGTGYLVARNNSENPAEASTFPMAYSHQPAKFMHLGLKLDLGTIRDTTERHAMIGYDEGYNIDYYGHPLRPYWKRNGMSPEHLFKEAENSYLLLKHSCQQFDADLTADAEKVGGQKYAQIVALAYRECVAACGLAADANGQPLFFTKEDTSNGDIATVDVIFPMDPIWVLLSPTLAKASLEPVFAYAASPHWKFPNAPHDLGTYPQVFGRDDGGEGMPVEESGNMIILCDAIAHSERSPEYASQWWPQLTQWAHYLEQYGIDPEDQLCTDDFMGHLAHNANLSVKAILALAAYGDLCRMRGDQTNADRYMTMAKKDAQHWVQVADTGKASLLAFDKPDTWSQKYNLVWDRLLGLNVFPDWVADKEVAFYKTQLQPYGLPLDSRTHLTKTDWTIWSAAMAKNPADFEAFVNPIWNYLNETTTRDPIADSYMTDDVHSGGMHARPVVGGLFIRMLSNPEIWHKWASEDHNRVGNWAPLPKPPVVTEIVPTARTQKLVWHYTTAKPNDNWTQISFDDSAWPSGPAGFASEGTPDAVVGTTWTTDDIWLRRQFTMPSFDPKTLRLLVYHDEDVEVYLNGIPAFSEPGYDNSYQLQEINPDALATLKPGAPVTIAVHCHQTTGGQGVDVGFASVDMK
jgi:hypothetical protein